MPPPRYVGASSFPPPAFSLAAPIEHPEAIVDAMLASLARGRLSAGAWDELHDAARRDACVEGVAAAFVSVSAGPRMKSAPSAAAAEFLFQAARFVDDVVGDDLGAALHLERALALAPAHLEAFGKLEAILERRQRPERLAQLYAASAPHRPRGQQALMLRRAADLFARAGDLGGDPVRARESAIEMWEAIVRLEPGDDEARSRLEALCVEAGRFRDAVRLNEQALARDPAPDDYTRGLLLERIVSLYADRLDQPERAIGPLEQLLLLDPAHAGARAVAEKLLSVKGLAGRAAAALARACEKDAPHRVEHYVSVELESAHGARRTQLYAQLGRLREERLEEPVGAMEAYEQALALDPGSEEIRTRYVAIATQLECHTDAVRVLERVLVAVKDRSVALPASVELGQALLGQRNTKRARVVLAEVFEDLAAPPGVVLRAARSLRGIYEATYDRRALCDVLNRIAHLTDDDYERREANLRLRRGGPQAQGLAPGRRGLRALAVDRGAHRGARGPVEARPGARGAREVRPPARSREGAGRRRELSAGAGAAHAALPYARRLPRMLRRPVWAVVPAKSFARGKSRLGPVLDDDDRARFARELLEHVLGVLGTCELDGVLVATDGDDVAALARAHGAQVLRDRGEGSLAAVVDGALADVAARGACAAVVFMADLPRLEPRTWRGRCGPRGPRRRARARSPGRHTNALAPRAAGGDAHVLRPRRQLRGPPRRRARRRARAVVVDNERIAFDVDGPADHARLTDAATGEPEPEALVAREPVVAAEARLGVVDAVERVALVGRRARAGTRGATS